MCNRPYWQQGPIGHKPVVYYALCVTIPTCHSRELFMHRVLCVTVTFSLCTICPECHNPDMSQERALRVQGSLCHSNVLFVHHALCVTIPMCDSGQLFIHRVLCVTVTFSLCTMPFVSQSRGVIIDSSLYTGFLCVCHRNVLFVHHALYVISPDVILGG